MAEGPSVEEGAVKDPERRPMPELPKELRRRDRERERRERRSLSPTPSGVVPKSGPVGTRLDQPAPPMRAAARPPCIC